MALKVADRVRENTSSTGAGGISFTGSPAGFQTFSSVLTSGDITYYTIEENDKWEVGIGTYGSDNLERNYILGSSNSGNKISLGGSGTVFITYPAEKSVYRNQESQAVVGASGLVFDNGTIIKDAKITELYDVNVSGTPASTHLLSFDVTNKGLLIGDSTGPSNNGNVLMGYGAGSGITTSNKNVIIGTEAAIQNQGGSQNVHIGYQSGPVHDGSSSVVYNAVSVGYQAGHKMRHYSTAVGHQAGIDAYEVGFVAVGYHAGSGIGSYSTVVGMGAGQSFNDDYATIIGYQAGYNGGGQDSVWVGRSAGYSSTGAARSVGVGKEAGKGSTASDSIYIGKSAGQNNTNDDSVFIGNASPASMGTLFKGDMNTKRVAVGVADVSLTDAFYIGINSNTDKGLVVKSAASQSADLTQWTTSSDGILASVSNSGIISANGLVASGAGLQVADNTPVVTANTLYSVGGGLYWNGSPLAGGGGTVTPAQLEYVSGIAVYASGEVGSGDVTTDQLNYVSGIAVYSSGQAIANEADIATNVTNISANVTDIVATSGIAAYASGNSITNESDISTNTTNIATNAADIVTASGALRTSINTNTTNISTNATGIVATSGIANYASGQAIANEGDIVATSGIANYASGQAIANETDIATNVSNISTNTSNISTNTSNISTNTSNISTNTTNITSATNIANYASGQAIDNEGDIVAVSGIAAYASGHAHDDLYVSGVAAYASGNTSNIAFGSNVEGDILYHDGTSFTRLPKGTDSHVLTMDGNVPAWEAATGGGGDVTTAQLVYVSGIAVYGSGQAESLNYASGVAAYASGNSLTNASDVVAVSGIAAYASGHVHDDLYVSGIATYASGQAIANETDIATNVSNISTNTSNISTNTTNIATNADNIVATSGIANYASGLAITNESNVAYASGQAIANETDIATNVSNISTNTSNISTNTSNISTNTTNITANASDIVAVSGIAHYASGHVHDDLYVSGIATYASGQAIANETDIATNVSNISTNTSNISTNTSNISTNTTNIASTTAVANYASGEALSLNAASGQAVYASGQVNVTTDGTAEASKALILDADKSFSGVKNGRLNQFDSWLYSSGVNVGNSGVVLSSSTPSDTGNTLYNVAGTLYFNGTQLASAGGASPTAQYASGQAIENQGDIVAVSGIAHYASGHAHDDLYVSGIAAYASGQAIANESDIATNASNISTNTSNISTNTTNIATNADNIVATSGIANYASGQAITNKTDIATNTSNISTNTSNISTNTSNISTNTTNISINSNRVIYASGQAIDNKSDIVAVSGIAHYASGHAHDDLYVSGIAAYASGQAIANETDIATNVSNISTNTSNISTNTSNISTNTTNIASTTAVANYASGQAIENESDIVATSGIANYASGLAITNEANVAYASGNTSNITFGSNAEGDILYHDGSTFTRLAKGTDNHVLTMNGNVPNWEAATSSTTNASGAIYQVQYNADGANFGADPGFWRTTDGQGGVHKNSHILAVSGTIIASSGDAAYISPVSIGSGTYVTGDNAIAIGAGTYGGGPKTRAAARGVAIGVNSIVSDTNGIAIGQTNTASDQYAIAIGAEANATAHESIAIGKGVNSAAFAGVAIGGQSRTRTSEGIAIGYKADAIGARSIAIGEEAGFNDTTTGHGGHSVAIGFKTVAREFAIALGHQAVAPDGHFVVASGSAQTDVLLSGVMKTHLTMPNGQQFRQMATAAQTTDLMQWQNSAGTNVASMTPSGVLNVYDIRTSGTEVAIGKDAKFVATGAGVAIGNAANANGHNTVVIGNSSDVTDNFSTAIGGHAGCAGHSAVAVGYSCDVHGNAGVTVGAHSEAASGGVTIGEEANAGLTGGGGAGAISIGYQVGAAGEKAIAIGNNASSPGDYGVAIGHRAVSHEKTWVIASGDNMATDVGISGVFGSYAAIPNDQKLAVGSPSGTVPTYRLDVMGHGAIARASGVIVGNSGIVLASNAPTVTTNTLYNDGGTLKFNGSAVGGSTLTAGSGIAIVDNKVHFESKSSGGKVLSSIKGDNDNHVTLMVSGTIVTNPADAARPGMVVIGSGAIGGYDNNVVIGKGASAGQPNNVVIGKDSKSLYWWGSNSVSIGIGCTSYANGVAMGYQATNFESDAIAIGIQARAGSNSIAIGKQVGWNNTNGVRRSVAIGHRAQHTSTNIEDVTVIGYHAEVTGHRGTALGSSSEAGEHAVALGNKAHAPDGGFVVASGSALTDVLLSGVMKTHLTMPNGQQFIQMATAAQTSDLMQWQNSAGTNVASMTPSGVLNTYGVVASGAGVRLERVTPTVTTDALYNIAGTLYFNGSTVGGGSAAGAIHQIQYNDGSGFAGDSQFLFSKANAAFTNDRVMVVSGVIIANSGDAHYTNPISIGSGAYVGYGATTPASQASDAIVIGTKSRSGKGTRNVVIGGYAYDEGTNTTGCNTVIGAGANTLAGTYRSIVIGNQAQVSTGHTNISIGNYSRVNLGQNECIVIGNYAGQNGEAAASNYICLGNETSVKASQGIAIGNNALCNSFGGIAIGRETHAGAAHGDGGGIAIGDSAEAGSHAVALGKGAQAPAGGFVLASGAALTDVLLSGVMKTHLTMPNGQQFIQMATAAQTSDLMQWQDSAGTNVASMTPSGILNVYDIRTSGTEVVLGQGATSTQANGVAIGQTATNQSAHGVAIGYGTSTYSTNNYSYAGIAIGNGANTTNIRAIAMGYNTTADSEAVAIGGLTSVTQKSVGLGWDADAASNYAVSIGYKNNATGYGSIAIGGEETYGTSSTGYGSIALGFAANATSDRSVAIGCEAQAAGTAWVIASGNTSAEVGISGVFGSYTAIPNDQKLAVGGNVPTYTVDALGHGAVVRGSGVIVGNSGVVLASNTPSVTTNTLYNAGGSLYFNGSAVGGGGAAPASGSIYEVQYNGDGTNLGADSDFTWNPSTNVMSVNGHISASTKSFLINHPTKPDKKLQYACLEGPENGVYVRGHTNDNLIDLPDYWTALVDPESITVQLTAKDAPQPFLYVSGVLNNQVHLISDREISAYYTVSATRKDVDPLLVEPDNY